MDEATVFYLFYITNCVLNALSAYAAIMLNIVTIHAIRKTSSLPKPLKTLLLSLAVSDLGVGLIVQPLYIAWMIERLYEDTESTSSYTIERAFSIVVDVFLSASFFGVLAISMDRFLSIHLHLRYQELVTHKRVVAAVILIWMFSVFFPLISLWIPIYITVFVYIVVFGVCFIFTTIVYLRIYLAVKRHTNQIQALQVQPEAHDEMTNFTRLRKSAASTFHVYIVFLLCYLPEYCMMITSTIVHESDITIVHEGFILYSWSLLLLNSSLNPVIYCWKMRHFRHAIMDLLRNIFEKHCRGN